MYPSTLHAAAAAEEDSQSASSVMEPKVLRGVMISCHARPTWNYTLVQIPTGLKGWATRSVLLAF